jgi:hypothetical protein
LPRSGGVICDRDMGNIRLKFLIFPIFGILISIFPKVIIVPFESTFGAGDHLSLGDLIVLCLPVVTAAYAYVMAFYLLLKEQLKSTMVLVLLGAIQTFLSLLEWGLIK